jgi:hypothetical protein
MKGEATVSTRVSITFHARTTLRQFAKAQGQ